MDRQRHKVYCAGPLFNPKECETMSEIASTLENAGYKVFLPQRDGLELARILPVLQEHGIPYEEASAICNKAIFALDVFQIMDSDGLLLNMNGRVPDEGAVAEAGIAWAHGKSLVIFNTDKRSLIQGNCNPMVMGLGDFKHISNYDEITAEFDRLFANGMPNSFGESVPCFETANKNGRQLSEYLASKKPIVELTELIIELFGNSDVKIRKKARRQIVS